VAEVSDALRQLLADVFALYVKTKNFHWHMSGRHFRDYHLLLDEHGDQIFAMTDDIAERARKIGGGTTLHSISDISRHQHLKDNNAEFVTPQDMLAELRADNQDLTPSLRSTHELCERHNDELGRQTGEPFDAELLFICAAFHDLGLLKKFSSEGDRFEVDSANAVRQFLEHHDVPPARIQVAWDAISLHTTPGIAAYKPLEVELLYNGVGLDVLGIGYEHFPEDLRKKIVDQYPRINFKQDIAKAFLGGFEHKTQTTEGTCNEDICSYFIRNYKRSNFYDQIQDSPFQNP
jgi:DNA-binding ferritin-like protein